MLFFIWKFPCQRFVDHWWLAEHLLVAWRQLFGDRTVPLLLCGGENMNKWEGEDAAA